MRYGQTSFRKSAAGIVLASHLCTCVLHRQLSQLHTLKLPKFFDFHRDFHQKWHFAHPELPFLAKSMAAGRPAATYFPRDVCLTVSHNHKVFLLYSVPWTIKKTVTDLAIPSTKGRGRPRKAWSEHVKNDVSKCCLSVASFTKEVNLRLAKCLLVFNRHLANCGLSSLVSNRGLASLV